MKAKIISMLGALLMALGLQAQNAEFETAIEAVKNMKVGYFYIGSTVSYIPEENVTDHIPQQWKEYADRPFEDVFGCPALYPQWLKMLRKAGINSIRLPIHWWKHLEADGSIDPRWMKHIRGIVDMIFDEGMYCIVNKGYDDWTIASMKEYKNRKDLFEYLWKQIAEEFKDYDHHLLFEGYNENIDEYQSWNFPSSACPGGYDEEVARDAYEAMNKYAQSFVDAVRSTGGNNTTRNLIVNTYACACGRGDWNGHLKDPLINFNLPKDVKDGHLILGVHTYFDTGNPIQTVKDEVDDCMKVINEYLIPKGAPIIISEWGADAVEELYYKYPKTTVDFAQYFMQKVRENGFANFCLSQFFLTEQYRLLPAFGSPDYIEAMMKGFYGDDYSQKLLTIDDYEIYCNKITFCNQYGGCCLTQRELKLSEYSGIRVEMDNTEDILLFIKGNDDDKQQYCVISSPTESFTFDESIVGETVTRIELLNWTEKKNVTNLYNVYLIKRDGSEETVGKEEIERTWGCYTELYGKRKQYVHTVAYDGQWSELNLFYDDTPLKLKNYKGIRVELAEKPQEGACHIKVYGDGEQKEDYLPPLTETSTTILFNTDIFSNEINRITLQNAIDGKNEVKVISAWLIRQDGTEEFCDLSPFWGCEITSKTEYATGINPIKVMSIDNAPHRIYNLNGQRLEKPQKGINIIDGKKVLVK